ncbi:MAG: DUF456 family protein [Candidatus Nomurabacteria bacterium]|nr:MAG: DUF456 family protein [Candidatus Nomurabacteria bacterium]
MFSTGAGHLIILTLCFIIVLVGFVGIAFPIVPSIPLIWFGILLYGIATDFSLVTPSFLLIISVLGLVVVLLDFVAYLWGGKQFRASLWGVLGAVIGGIIGSFFGLLFAFVVGPFFGAVVSQLVVGRDRVFAVETKHYIIIGYMGGMIIKFAVGVAMIGLFLWQLLRGL